MTYDDFRRYGYVSRLVQLRCGGGPTESQVNAQNTLTSEQTELARQEREQSAKDTAQREKLTAPLVAKETALAAGDRTAATAAAMPTISKISAGYQGAKQQIMNNLPPGAARDTALANLETQKATGIAGAQAGMVENAPEVLANVGQGIGAFSIQELGAALSGFSGASTSNSSAANMEMQQSQAKWGPIVGLAQAAGSAVGGTDLTKLSDRRLKKNIRALDGVLLKLRHIQPVTFDYTNGKSDQIGVIAQEVLPEFPQAVSGSEGQSTYRVDYQMLIAVALQACRELDEKLQRLSGRLDQVEWRSLRPAGD